MSQYTEDTLIEQPAIEFLAGLGWETISCWSEVVGPEGATLGRENHGEVVLSGILENALQRLNPGLPGDAIGQAVEELTRDRGALDPAAANREIYDLLKDGVKVSVQADDGWHSETVETVRVIDWTDPASNDFLLASQMTITGEFYERRPDLIGFVNGLPLVLIELKRNDVRLQDAYRDNLRDYKTAIPQLFWYNALIILSNGRESRVGTITSDWEHFSEWKRVASEDEQPRLSIETMLAGTCQPDRLLDLIENFTVFLEKRGTVKILAKNHQYHGVNAALDGLEQAGEHRRLGVFWHTQGSGKSISMIFLCQKILRKKPGNWRFVIVTDRKELDEQIYGNFVSAGAITEQEAHAESGDHLRGLLGENHRYIFTLIQKFHTQRGERYPVISERDDIIVITDEAHRSQYDTFALNMRDALPNASFLGFTGTPLIQGEEQRTREVFGDYVSVYNFRQSIEDGATVPLYYENRIPEMQLTNQNLNQDIERILEAAELDEAQERRLEREFAREYHIITRDDRLEVIAEDVVTHFLSRGHKGKAMFICIDKATAVRMHDKVRAHWQAHRDELAASLADRYLGDDERAAIEGRIAYMDETDMAVVVSQSQNEIAEMADKGLDIVTHRKRMVTEDMDEKFKDPEDPFRIVFVCAMWMTGFDVPSCSTIYLDKPMRNHTLMQTIARANRVFPGKHSGLIVDYAGVFRSLQEALAIYGASESGGDSPVADKSELVAALAQAISEAAQYCRRYNVDIQAIVQIPAGSDWVVAIDQAVERLLVNDEVKREFLAHAALVNRLYAAILPDPAATEHNPLRTVLHRIANTIRNLDPEADITGPMDAVDRLLDRSISSEGFIIREDPAKYDASNRVDLSQLDFDALRLRFQEGRKRTEAEKLRGAINARIIRMVQINKTRMDYLERFQKLVDEYNAGSLDIDRFFEELLGVKSEIDEEDERHVREGLTEEELAVFDLLTKPAIDLTDAERVTVKDTARQLLDTLKQELLVLDWKKKQQSRAAVRLHIEKTLDDGLPPTYDEDRFSLECNEIYQHIFDAYASATEHRYAA